MSGITGESEPIARDAKTAPNVALREASNVAFSGALVLSGDGTVSV